MLFVIDAETTPGCALSCVEKAIPERESLVRRIVRRPAQRDAHRQQIARVEARLHALHAEEAANEQRRADEQHERQRHFADDEAAAQAAGARGRRSSRARRASRSVSFRFGRAD